MFVDTMTKENTMQFETDLKERFFKAQPDGTVHEITEKEYRGGFSRLYPYAHFHDPGATAKDVLIKLGKGLETGSVSIEEAVGFLNASKLVFLNTHTNMLSQWFYEEPDSYSRAIFHNATSCSCLCGPLSDPCNEQGPGSKVSFSFKKEETLR